jgi:hypothetical protein
MIRNKITAIEESQRDDLLNILKLVKENSYMMEKLSKISSEHSTLLNEHQTKLVSA